METTTDQPRKPVTQARETLGLAWLRIPGFAWQPGMRACFACGGTERYNAGDGPWMYGDRWPDVTDLETSRQLLRMGVDLGLAAGDPLLAESVAYAHGLHGPRALLRPRAERREERRACRRAERRTNASRRSPWTTV